ncbi:GNAT family N-acetyltransferase [Amycolatopsis sp. NPDC050768]|uniref:GNAT family N-acetyltransferase n=1 Tax=unclassified Amycolatopsis TaxID=2618356 RepID=UPI001C6A2CFA|nr:N-acetyltransferase [Amycolatopsis sp. DSM 110486]
MSDETRVVRNDEKHRYEVYADDQLAGFTQYLLRDNQTVFTHTEIDKAFGGRGLGTTLATYALDDVVANGGVIVPVCPFIAAFLRKHTGYEEHVQWPEGTSDAQ